MSSTFDLPLNLDFSKAPEAESAPSPLPVAPETFPRLPSAAPAPLEKVLRIARDIGARHDTRHQAALFESLRPRLLHEIGAARNAAELETLRGFVELFYQLDFLVQTRYFDQLEGLLRLLDHRSRTLAAPIFDPCAGAALEESELLRLPLPIQRHLARKGHRAEVFACHEHNLIAREVVHHVHRDRLDQFLTLDGLNRTFFEEVLRGLELGDRRDLIVPVLCHNRCPIFFVGRYLAHLDLNELHGVIQARTTHSEVRRRAMLLTIERRSSAAN
jgi:hypothetical protein